MGGYRAERIAEMIHREVAQRLRTDVKDLRLRPISITRVHVTRDLRRATINYLPLGGGSGDTELQEALDEAAKGLRGPVGRALRLRHAPEIVFEVDTHTEEAFRISEILTRIRAERESEVDGELEVDVDDADGGEE